MLEYHIKEIAKILNVKKSEVLNALCELFENTSDEVDTILDELYEKMKDGE